MDGILLAIACAIGEVCTHGTAIVTGIYNLDELDPSYVFFNPLPLFLFIFFLVDEGLVSTRILAGTTTENFFDKVGTIGAAGSLGARSVVVVVADTIGISCAESTVIVCSLEKIVKLNVPIQSWGAWLTAISRQ
ncbi:hypothetical protein Scep_007628 [Stephania cephalantha]|uniref:Uncharacterized protein n=1 Tax=Stephania cephalantha TaxID=152367 RepID=A0AAP0PQ83_9MAGN